MTRPVFLVYCPVTDDTISDLLGRPDYSYYFVMKRFAPLLAELGDVRQVRTWTTSARPSSPPAPTAAIRC